MLAKISVLLPCLIISTFCYAQQVQQQDSLLLSKNLPEITVVGKGSKSDYQQMPEVVGTNIYAAKKNCLIIIDNVKGNVAMNTMRQVLAKVPGIHIWESDPSGIQIGIAARGLSPNRSWEFNVRQNGYDIAADPFGYPEAYYNPQLQAVQRIEVVRGQGAIQYGPQFGGMINYILRNGSEIDKPFSFETNQTFGSNNFFNSFNAIGGKNKKINYYAFFDHKNGNGWRQNSNFFTDAGFSTLTYQWNKKIQMTIEVMQSHIRSKQPGGLTDSLLYENTKTSVRGRNWFDITWTTPAVTFLYHLNNNFRWQTKLFGTIGNRNSVGILQSILINDSINASTGQYNPRVLNIDQYRNVGLESRLITEYKLGKRKQTFAGGIRLYTGKTWRRADGKGTIGSDYDMTLTGIYSRDINFRSKNAAAFFENIFSITNKILIVPGLRYEWLKGSAEGLNSISSSGEEIWLQPITRSRKFLLAALGAEFHNSDNTEFYSSFAQAYRPIQFANLQAPPSTDVIDPELKDAKGYNLDLGYRGKIKNFLQFDASIYYLYYGNRVGAITSSTGERLITNVGTSISKGFEGFVSINLMKAFQNRSKEDISLFASYSYINARYGSDNKDANIKNKLVENAPKDILRTGISSTFSSFNFTVQVNYVGSVFSDANNTTTPSLNGQSGIIPSYILTDISSSFEMSKNLTMKGGINNLFNTKYFTRRAGGYPGPGALPGDGRTAFITIQGTF